MLAQLEPVVLPEPLGLEAEFGHVGRFEPLLLRFPAVVAEVEVRHAAEHLDAMLERQHLVGAAQLHAGQRRLLVHQVPGTVFAALAEHADHRQLARRKDRALGDQRESFLAPEEIEAGHAPLVAHHVRQRVLERGDHEIQALVLRLRLLESAEPSFPVPREQRITVARDAHHHAEDGERDQQLDQGEAPYLRRLDHGSHAISWYR